MKTFMFLFTLSVIFFQSRSQAPDSVGRGAINLRPLPPAPSRNTGQRPGIFVLFPRRTPRPAVINMSPGPVEVSIGPWSMGSQVDVLPSPEGLVQPFGSLPMVSFPIGSPTIEPLPQMMVSGTIQEPIISVLPETMDNTEAFPMAAVFPVGLSSPVASPSVSEFSGPEIESTEPLASEGSVSFPPEFISSETPELLSNSFGFISSPSDTNLEPTNSEEPEFSEEPFPSPVFGF
ncbi:unnamed protein product [Agarophyton chilense]